jgi:hypothetical protein
MIPQTAATLVAFVLLVMPGITYEVIRERNLPPRDVSAFRETSRVVAASVIFTSLAVLVLWAARHFVPDLLVDPDAAVRDDNYVSAQLGLTVRTVVAAVLLACLLAFVGSWVVDHAQRRFVKPPKYSRQTALFTSLNTMSGVPQAAVRKADGSVLIGQVAHMDFDEDNPYVVLGANTMIIRTGQDPQQADAYVDRIAVPLSQVSELWLWQVEESTPHGTPMESGQAGGPDHLE